MAQIRVLVTDDSDFARELIIAILGTDKDIAVIGQARNGQEAVELVAKLKPDIVTMDIEMPVMNGLEAIEHIMASHAVPILVVTTRADANTAYAAISKGALDLVVKPDVNLQDAEEFIGKIKLLSKIKVITHISGKRSPLARKSAVLAPGVGSNSIVAIASSTGGPEALSIILSSLPEKFPAPIVIAQHNTDGFIPGMVEWLKRISKVSVKVGQEGDALAAGTAYVSPSEKHMQITPARKISFIERDAKDIYRPSCDILLTSAAKAYGTKAIGVILTGMGSDGALGMKAIKAAQGITIAQNEQSCVVFGMPKVAIDLGCVDKVLSVDDITGEIASLVSAAPLSQGAGTL